MDKSLEELKLENDLLKGIIEMMPGNVYWKDTTSRYLGCNREYADILGLESPHHILGKADTDLYRVDLAKKAEVADRKVLREGKTLSFEELGLNDKGEMAVYLSQKTPLFDREQNIVGLLGVSIDITDRKKFETLLKVAKEEAEKTNQLKSEFIRNMEHDIRTPFTGIIGLSEHLAGKESDPIKKELLEEIMQCGTELLEYCNGILDFSRIEHGALPVSDQSFDLRDVIESVLALERPPAHAKKLDLNVNISPNYPQTLIGDLYRLQRILINLVSNAIKFTHQGSVTLDVKVLQLTENRRAVVQFCVIDTGIGISIEDREVLFQKFRKLSSSAKGLYRGKGLGLYIVKQFIDEMKGDISVTSEPGQGAVFTCTMPFKVPFV